MRTIIAPSSAGSLGGCSAATTQPMASPPPASSAAATASSTWQSGTPPAWTPTADMVEFHVGHTATLLSDGRVLVAGGDGPAAAEAERLRPR